MNNFEKSPIFKLINQLSEQKDLPINFEQLKEELLRKDENNNPIYYLQIKEGDNLAILYNDITNENPNKNCFAYEVEQYCKSLILEKSTLKPIGTQYNKIIYNQEAVTYIKDKNWDNIVIQKCFEGTMLLVFHDGNEWIVSTRRCLNSKNSTWVKNKSYWDMFEEARDNKFNFDDLNKNYCYHFILVHYKNRNIVNYNYLGRNYKELYHTLTTEKYTLNEIPNENINVNTVEEQKFENIDDLYKSIETINNNDLQTHKISTEGYVLRVYDGEPYKSPFKILKIQTPIYQKIMKIKPNNSNIHQSYMELYQKDKLSEFLPFFTKYNNDIIKRIHISIRNLAKEVLDLYHSTRQKKNSHIYTNLPDQYRKILYGLHGLYIQHRKQDFNGDKDVTKQGEDDKEGSGDILEKNLTRSINVHDVYNYLKNLPPQELRQLFLERTLLMDDPNMIFLNKVCINTKTQSTLMFGNILKTRKKKEDIN